MLRYGVLARTRSLVFDDRPLDGLGATVASAMIPSMEQRHVKLSGDVEGSFVIEEALADGRFVVAPEWPSKETSADAILERAGGRRMTPEEFDKHFGDLPTDGEG